MAMPALRRPAPNTTAFPHPRVQETNALGALEALEPLFAIEAENLCYAAPGVAISMCPPGEKSEDPFNRFRAAGL